MTDKEWFCDSVRKYESSFYSLAFSLLKNEADASEAVSEAILRAYSNLNKLNSKSAFKAWMLRIVHNTSVEIIRKNSHSVSIDDSVFETYQAEDNYNDTDIRVTVRRAVDNLPTAYKVVTELFYYENLSVNQIAEITSTNSAAVRKQLSRARAILREMLKDDFLYE